MSDEIKALLERAPLSFVGTVERLGAATMGHVRVDPRTAVVRVDHVLHAPHPFRLLAGRDVTVQLLPSIATPAAGESFAFFVADLDVGHSIAASEIGRLPSPSVHDHLQRAREAGKVAGAFDGIVHEMKQAKLRTHMKAADVLLVGRAIALEQVGGGAWSEHDPDWWRVTIAVDHVETGAKPGATVQALFANSADIAWRNWPKPAPGQSGLWVLHKTTGDLKRLAPFQLNHPDDLQPLQQLDVLRAAGA